MNTSIMSSVPMSYYHKPRPNPLDNRTLFQILDHTTTQHPDKEAIVFYNENSNRSCLTFQQLKDQSIKFAASLLKLGFKRGDRILIYAPNSLEFVISWMAVNRVGACAVLMCPGDVEFEELELLKRLKCCGMICGLNMPDNQRQRILSEIEEIAEQKNPEGESYVKSIITINQGDAAIAHAHVAKYEDLMNQVDKGDELKLATFQSKVDSEDHAVVCFTSGSTGEAKAVVYSHFSLVSGVNLALPPGTGYDGNTRAFSGWPISWGCGAPVVAIALVIGFTYITTIYTKLTIKDSFQFMFDILKAENCTSCSIPQEHVYRLLGEKIQEKYDFSKIKVFGFGSQIVPRKTIQALLDVFPQKRAILAYAMTEVFTVGLQPLSHATITKQEDYGKVYMFPDMEVKVIDDQGHVVPLGSKGEICVRGPKVFLEYLEDPEGSTKTKDANGWVHTSDYGIMFDRARIKVLGRKTDLIDSHNQAVFPVEVEEILIEHPDVLDVVAVGVPAGNDGKEDICACVIEEPRSNLKEKVEELHKWCEQEYSVANSNHLKPKQFRFFTEFPITDAAKIDRRAIKRLAREMKNGF